MKTARVTHDVSTVLLTSRPDLRKVQLNKEISELETLIESKVIQGLVLWLNHD